MAFINEPSSIEALQDDTIKLILTEIYRITGYSFINYTSAIVMRRLQRRLIDEQIASLHGLLQKMKMDPDFAFKLIADFSINVTEMFRNPHFFKYFRDAIIPHLRGKEFIRIWVAGCSTGEEVYSLAVLLHEEGLYQRCRIYATDMNESIILKAKSGSVPIKRMDDYENNYILAGGVKQLNEYFTNQDKIAYLRGDLLKNILFSHHNLVSDRSFNEFHVIFCRNVLIYFNQWLRDHVHSLLLESLALNGYFVLGDKETIRFTKHAAHFHQLSPEQKIYLRTH